LKRQVRLIEMLSYVEVPHGNVAILMSLVPLGNTPEATFSSHSRALQRV